MYELIIFDLDGTIADSSKGIFNSIRYVQKKLNLECISEEDMKYHLGPPMNEAYKRNFNLNPEELDLAIMYHKEYSFVYGISESRIYEGMHELLVTLNRHGIKTAVATMKPDEMAKALLNHHNLSVDSVHGHSNDLTKKDLIKKCISDFSIMLEKTVMIGDTKSDMESAHALGIDFIGVSYGYGFNPGDENCVDSPFELIKLLIKKEPSV